MSSQSHISLLLDIEWMVLVVRTDYFFKIISLFEFERTEVHDLLEDTLTSIIFGHKLDQFIHYTLKIGVAFFTHKAITVQI